ncbi:MAG: NfeD family protein [Betaproteobacteria bacterium]|jgi:membrane protein implicated in regulation of membrane protease activity
MAGYVWWFVLGFGLLMAELLTGTFYLLMLALAAGTAGVAALLGAPFAPQVLVAAVIGFAGSLWLRKSRAGRPSGIDALQNMDVGQVVRIDHWATNRTARASYRGAMWDVELAPGEEPATGDFVIRDIRANRLIVAVRR